ncbi:hypothetical protein ACQ86N_33990 [Puia sp. P3]|uniref:hypothetical protein n=1 Tax=Puia sp. P3 TaxID=3423952 RepID=UPI003D67DA6D
MAAGPLRRVTDSISLGLRSTPLLVGCVPPVRLPLAPLARMPRAGGVVGIDGVVDGYAVYDHQRLVVAGDGGYAAEADIGACAGVA